MTDYTEKVQRGLAALEEYGPGVTAHIDLPLLDISAGPFCAASQVVSMMFYDEPGMVFYSQALEELDIDKDEAVTLGFELPREMREILTPGDLDIEYGELTAAWHAALAARR